MSRICSLLLFVLLPLITRAETSPAPASGIEGFIVMAPSHPGPVKKDEPEAVVSVPNVSFDVEKDGKKVASFMTNPEGHFQVSLPPGHYVISRNDSGGRIGHWRFEADVKAGETTQVRWTGDSGMR